jgi:hypothetical protein
MKLLFLSLLLAVAPAYAGDLWEWAPGHWSGTDDRGHEISGWEWAPGHQTWTDDRGHTTELWEWSPGHWDIEERLDQEN